MQVAILAGGMGTRIAPVARGLPKALLPIAGRPFIAHQFALLARSDVRDVVLCVGCGAGQIEELVGDGSRFGMRARYAREDPAHLLGTGGALVNALPLLVAALFVLYGDSYLPMDYRAAAEDFERRRADAMMCVFRNDGQWDRSNARVSEGRVAFYSKRARPGEAEYIDYGLSAFRKAVVERYAGAPLPLDLGRIQEELAQRGELLAHVVKDRFYEIGKPEGLADLRRHLEGAKE